MSEPIYDPTDLKTAVVFPPPAQRRPQRIAVIPGDGIGREVIAEAVKVLDAARQAFSLPIEFIHYPWSADHYLETGVSMPPGMMDRLRDEHAAILIGAFGDPRIPDMRHAADILLGIRFQLDLYVNFRPVKLLDERLCPLKGKRVEDVDFVVFRENTEGPYVNIGGSFKKGTPDEVSVQEEIHTRKGVERIIRAAFDWAVANGKKRVLMTDKSNVMRHGHDLWQRAFREVARRYPSIEASHMFVDALAMQLIRTPEAFDVIVANNLFGDILTDLGAGLQGGLGVAASANLHPGKTSMFEPVHGSAPPLVGTGKANPVGAVLSAALMLRDLGHPAAASALETAVETSVRAGETTADLGGSLTTSEVGEILAGRVAS
jgi:3-isopropylmalate dehydrogenase